jgi:hypothetical protein
MLPNNRVIDRGFGVMHCASVGLKVAFATSVDLFPVNGTPMVSMQQFQKPKRYPATGFGCRQHGCDRRKAE